MKQKKTRRISIFECFWVITKLEKLKDLFRHESRWAHQIELARPLKKLGIKEDDQYRFVKIKEKISKLIPIAVVSARETGIWANIVVKKKKVGVYPPKYEDENFNVFFNHDALMSIDESNAHNFELTIDILNEIIGCYLELRTRKLIRLLNPLRLVASILRIPVTIIEYMGFEIEGTFAEKVLSHTLQAAMGLLLFILGSYFGEKSELVRALISMMKTLWSRFV